ncbi:histidine kinase [Flavobacteriaceae bacterium AU392]|nr:histidine kinase [Flavobacteriaceae bacterium]RKM85963.1 histidine kinase [Flavobacteriaceae bacterium AU392]
MKKYIELRLVKILAVFYGFIVLLSFSKRIFMLYKKGRLENVDWGILIFGQTFSDWLCVMIYMVVAAGITKKMFEVNLKYAYIILIHIVLGFFMSWYLLVAIGIMQLIAGTITYEIVVEHISSFEHFMTIVDVNLITYFFMAGIIYIYYYVKKLRETEIQKGKLENQLVSTKMQILKAQLQPHFLFNTLNSISSLIKSDPDEAQNTLVDLSELLREILYFKEINLIPFETELSLLKRYINIMLTRFSDHLSIEFDISEELKNALVPSMLLQPIIENSIKHGYSQRIKNLKILLKAYKSEDKLIIEMSNNGKPFLKPLNEGHGIKNTQNRLSTLFGDDHEFYFLNLKEKKFVVLTKIVIPFIENTNKKTTPP